LEAVALAGGEAFVVAGDTAVPARPEHGLRLLPHFDAYGIGCHPRELVFPGDAGQRALGGGQAGTIPVMLLDGCVGGIWHRRRSGRRLAVTVEPFGTLTTAQRRDLDAQVARLGEMLDCPPELTIGAVTTGHHA
jgi:hypothetical protein